VKDLQQMASLMMLKVLVTGEEKKKQIIINGEEI